MEGCTIQNNSNSNMDHLSQMIQHFFPYAQEKLGFFKPVMVSFQSDEENANKLLGRTAHYNPDEFSIAIFVDGRHPKDILRSFSHELVHHAQNCNGDFESTGNLGPGYAQENEAMRNAELDAYKRGNIIFRDFEDLIKKGDIEIEIDFEKAGEPKMSLKEWKNNELNGLLMEKWGYKVQKEEQEIFAPNHYCAHHVRENISGLEGRCVDHNWNERLQEVTAYEVDFGDNDIRTLRTEELTILEASLPEGHAGHMARKEDHEEEDVNEDRADAALNATRAGGTGKPPRGAQKSDRRVNPAAGHYLRRKEATKDLSTPAHTQETGTPEKKFPASALEEGPEDAFAELDRETANLDAAKPPTSATATPTPATPTPTPATPKTGAGGAFDRMDTAVSDAEKKYGKNFGTVTTSTRTYKESVAIDELGRFNELAGLKEDSWRWEEQPIHPRLRRA